MINKHQVFFDTEAQMWLTEQENNIINTKSAGHIFTIPLLFCYFLINQDDKCIVGFRMSTQMLALAFCLTYSLQIVLKV